MKPSYEEKADRIRQVLDKKYRDREILIIKQTEKIVEQKLRNHVRWSCINIKFTASNTVFLSHGSNSLLLTSMQIDPLFPGMPDDIQSLFLIKNLLIICDMVFSLSIRHFDYFKPFFNCLNFTGIDVFNFTHLA